jgi:hypothetical protein
VCGHTIRVSTGQRLLQLAATVRFTGISSVDLIDVAAREITREITREFYGSVPP